jgi:hypothetical protein
MRQLASFLLIAIVLPAAAADIWRWKDENGVVHYSDQPTPGAERVNHGAASAPAASTAATAPPESPPKPAQPAEQFRYSSCTVIAPLNDEVFNAVNTVGVSLELTPGLRPDHRVQLLYDGAVYADWPARTTGSELKGLYRGTHTLAVKVLDTDGRTLCAGPAISFHLRQPSILSPGRKPQAK